MVILGEGSVVRIKLSDTIGTVISCDIIGDVPTVLYKVKYQNKISGSYEISWFRSCMIENYNLLEDFKIGVANAHNTVIKYYDNIPSGTSVIVNSDAGVIHTVNIEYGKVSYKVEQVRDELVFKWFPESCISTVKGTRNSKTRAITLDLS